MKTYISMLRGINVSGQKKINMEELRALYETLGFKNPKTYIQSGNVIFECSESNVSSMISKIERGIKKSYGFEVPVQIRTKTDLQRLIDNNPFAKKDTGKLHVTFLSGVALESSANELIKFKSDSEEFVVSGREIYLFCPDGYGKSKLSNNLFERKLKLSATTRNWKTVNKLLELAGG